MRDISILDRCQFENGRLVKVDGQRPSYMAGQQMIKIIQELAVELAEIRIEGFKYASMALQKNSFGRPAPTESNISGTDEYRYMCGNIPMVGDLISFGSQSTRFVVTEIQENGGTYHVISGERKFEAFSLAVMHLVARHGKPER